MGRHLPRRSPRRRDPRPPPPRRRGADHKRTELQAQRPTRRPPPAPRRTRQPHRLTLTDPTDRCSSTDNFRWPSTDIFRWLLTNGLPACVLPTEAPVPDHPTLRPEPDRDFAVHFHATIRSSRRAGRSCATAQPLRGLLFGSRWSVASDAEEMVLTGRRADSL